MWNIYIPLDLKLPSGNLTVRYWKYPSYSEFSHEHWCFSIVFCMLTTGYFTNVFTLLRRLTWSASRWFRRSTGRPTAYSVGATGESVMFLVVDPNIPPEKPYPGFVWWVMFYLGKSMIQGIYRAYVPVFWETLKQIKDTTPQWLNV